MPKVSIVIPVFNTEKYLKRCLDSVCSQTLSDLEIICINDSSTDKSLAILKEYENHIKVINLESHVGSARARNLGINLAKGEYVGFVDSDDFVDFNFYETLYKKAIETNADIVKGDIKTFDNLTGISQKEDWLDINKKVRLNPSAFCFTFTTAIYKRAFLLDNNIHFLENLIHFEDPYFTIKAGLFCKKLEVIDNVFYYYCNNPNSASRNVGLKHIESQIVGSKRIINLLKKYPVSEIHYNTVYNFTFGQMLEWCNRLDVSDLINEQAVKGLLMIMENCPNKEMFLKHHFLNKKNEHKVSIIKKLRQKMEMRD